MTFYFFIFFVIWRINKEKQNNRKIYALHMCSLRGVLYFVITADVRIYIYKRIIERDVRLNCQ